MYLDEHVEKWDELHQQQTFRPKYPNESVVRFLKLHFPDGQSKRLLDLGCGAGRHVMLLAKEGFQTHGIDISQAGIDYTKRLLSQHGYHANVIKGSLLQLPYESDYFDGLISCGVLCYFVEHDVQQVVKEIHRVLKPGGKAFIVTRSTRDKRFGKGIPIEKHTFRMADNETDEEGMIMHFLDADAILELCKAFSEVRLGWLEESMDSLDQYNSDFLITLIK